MNIKKLIFSDSHQELSWKMNDFKTMTVSLLKKVKRSMKIVGLKRKQELSWDHHVLNSRLRYKFNALKAGIELNKRDQANLFNLRRNIHRIEKGLSYENVKEVFAESYILETVQYLEIDARLNYIDTETRQWCEAVLNVYFNVCGNSATIETARKRYKNLNLENKYPDRVPYLCNTRPQLSVDYDALYNLALRRRSVRFYTSKTVESTVVEKALKLALQSPSACNRQSFKYLFFNQPEIVREISLIPGGVAGYSIPSVVVLIGSYRGYFDERDINAPVIDASLSAMAFLFALETLGLSSVCINWPNLLDREEKIRRVIHLESDEFVIMLIGIGYPDSSGKIPYSAKRPVNEVLSNNERVLN